MMENEWFEEDDTGSPWGIPTKMGTIDSWLDTFRKESVTVILCPNQMIGRLVGSLHTALMADDKRKTDANIIVLPSRKASLFETNWAWDVVDEDVEIIFIIPNSRHDLMFTDSGDTNDLLLPFGRLKADRIIEVSMDPYDDTGCIYRVLHDHKFADLLGKILFIG